MNNKRLGLMGSLIFLVLILFSTNVLAYTDTSNNVVPYDKKWTIVFTKKLSTETLNSIQLQKDNIIVLDSLGRRIEVILSRGSNDNSIIVNPPMLGYSAGENYTLMVKTDIFSNEGKKLRAIAQKKFTIDSNEKAQLNPVYSVSTDLTGKNTSYISFRTSKNDDNNVSAYRVIPTETSPSNLTVKEAQNLKENQYKEVKRIKGVNQYNVNFSPLDFDIEGNKVNTYSPYYIYYVLSVPNNDEAYNYQLSDKVEYWRYNNNDYAAQINSVKYLTKDQSTIKFTTSEEDNKNIETYRVIATETSPSYLRIDDAMRVKEGRYKDIKRVDGVNEYNLDFSPKDFDMEGRMMNTNSKYYIYYVLSIPYDKNCYYDYTLSEKYDSYMPFIID